MVLGEAAEVCSDEGGKLRILRILSPLWLWATVRNLCPTIQQHHDLLRHNFVFRWSFARWHPSDWDWPSDNVIIVFLFKNLLVLHRILGFLSNLSLTVLCIAEKAKLSFFNVFQTLFFYFTFPFLPSVLMFGFWNWGCVPNSEDGIVLLSFPRCTGNVILVLPSLLL